MPGSGASDGQASDGAASKSAGSRLQGGGKVIRLVIINGEPGVEPR
jgi:hypothetical protein